jgi:hypothetical protein
MIIVSFLTFNPKFECGGLCHIQTVVLNVPTGILTVPVGVLAVREGVLADVAGIPAATSVYKFKYY